MSAKLNNNNYYFDNHLSLLVPTQSKKCLQVFIMVLTMMTVFVYSTSVFSDDNSAETPQEKSSPEAAAPAAIVDAPQVSAEVVQETAASSVPEPNGTFKQKKEEEGYVVNLRELIEKSKKRIEQVNGKLDEQAKRSRNLQREEKAREYYQKAMRLFEEGKMTEAQELWEKAIKITEHPEMKDYIRESVVKNRKQEDAMRSAEERQLRRLELERGYSAREVEAAYQKGVELFKDKKFLAAKGEFELVDEMFPDHKATRSYLMLIDREIDNEQQVLIEQRLKEQAHVKRETKEEWRKDMQKKERLNEEQRLAQAETLYEEALRFYKSGFLENAKAKFSEVEWIVPNYKATLKYISRIEKELASKEKKMAVTQAKNANKTPEELWQEEIRKQRLNYQDVKSDRNVEEAQFVYDSALALYNKGMLEEARLKFLEVRTLSPGFKATDKYLTKLNKQLPELAVLPTPSSAVSSMKSSATSFTGDGQVSAEKLAEFKREAEWIYNDAVALFNAKNHTQAYEKFRQVENLSPGFKDAAKYMARLEKTLNIAPTAQVATTSVDKSKIKKLYKHAARLQKENQTDAAREVFEEILRLDPGHSEARKSLDKIIVASAPTATDTASLEAGTANSMYQAEAEDLYQQAVMLYESGQHAEAREKFEAVKRLVPGYKATNNYFERLGKLTGVPVENVSTSSEKSEPEKAAELAGAEDSVASKPDKKKKLVKEKSKIRRDWNKMKSQRNRKQTRTEKEYNRYQAKIKKALAEKRDQEKVKFEATLDYYYTDAVKLFESGDYSGSQMKFLTVEGMRPKYKATRRFLSQIEEILSQQSDMYSGLGKADKVQIVEESTQEEEPEVDLKAPEPLPPQVKQKKVKKETVKISKVKEPPIIVEETPVEEEPLVEVEPVKIRDREGKRRNENALQKMRQQSEESRKRKEVLERQYQEVLKLMRNNDVIIAKKKLDLLDEKATHERLDTTYRLQLKKKIELQRRQIEGMRYQQERQLHDIERRREEELARQDYNLQHKKEETVANLENKIRTDEERLARDKQREQERIEKERRKNTKEARLASDEEKRNDAVQRPSLKEPDPPASKKELTKLYKARQKELEAERARIRRSLQENLEALYQKAVVSYRAGDDESAVRIFEEIETMQPNYKSTKEFISKLQKNGKPSHRTADTTVQSLPEKTSPSTEKSSKFQARSDSINQALDIIEENL